MFIICVQNVRDPDRSLPKIIQQTSTTTGLGAKTLWSLVPVSSRYDFKNANFYIV